jgi:hypothetical protein
MTSACEPTRAHDAFRFRPAAIGAIRTRKFVSNRLPNPPALSEAARTFHHSYRQTEASGWHAAGGFRIGDVRDFQVSFPTTRGAS